MIRGSADFGQSTGRIPSDALCHRRMGSPPTDGADLDQGRGVNVFQISVDLPMFG